MSERPVPVAAFDLDGTLTEGGSVFKWLRAVSGSKPWRAAVWRLWPLAWGALRSGTAADTAKESLFAACLRGRARTDVAKASAAFATRHVTRKSREKYVERLAWHLAEGHRVVIVSASPEIYVTVVAELLGAHGAIGTRLATDPLDRLTGGYLGLNCRGDEKRRRLAEWITTNADDGAEIYAYGNSRGDRKMLASATHPFNAGHLGRLGALRQFPRLK